MIAQTLRNYLPAACCAAAFAALALAPSAHAGDDAPGASKKLLPHAADPADKANNTWIALSGKVLKTTPDSFRLDYGKGVITVEMDDFDSFAEGHQLFRGDQVAVYGRIDDDVFEDKKIEAASVFVEGLGTHFYASAVDEEDFDHWNVSVPIVSGAAELTGVVTAIDGKELTLRAGDHEVIVDTDALPVNVIDNKGFLRVRVGDRVKVQGTIDHDLFERAEIKPTAVTKLAH